MVTRRIWCKRDQFVFKQSFLHPIPVMQQATVEMNALKSICILARKRKDEFRTLASKWSPSLINMFKINWMLQWIRLNVELVLELL